MIVANVSSAPAIGDGIDIKRDTSRSFCPAFNSIIQHVLVGAMAGFILAAAEYLSKDDPEDMEKVDDMEHARVAAKVDRELKEEKAERKASIANPRRPPSRKRSPSPTERSLSPRERSPSPRERSPPPRNRTPSRREKTLPSGSTGTFSTNTRGDYSTVDSSEGASNWSNRDRPKDMKRTVENVEDWDGGFKSLENERERFLRLPERRL